MGDFLLKRLAQNPDWDDRSEALLFAVLREVLGTVTGIVQTGMDIHSIHNALAHAGKEFLDYMVAFGLTRLGAAEDATGLDERAKWALRRALILERDRISISKAFAAEGIDHLFFKGVLSDPLWWGGRGMRGASDIDILVPRSAEDGAALALVNLGYERIQAPTRRATEEASKERLFHHSDMQSHFPVDLHLGLLNDPPYRDPVEQIFRRAVYYETAVGAIRGPCREDMLVLAAGNLGQSCFAERHKLALDAACLLLRENPDLNAAASRAEEWHVTIPLWGLLRLIEERLHVTVPDQFLNRLAPFRPIRGIVEHLAGIRRIPRRPERGGRLILASWPLSGRIFWPLAATWQWTRLRIADRIRSRNVSKPMPAQSDP